MARLGHFRFVLAERAIAMAFFVSCAGGSAACDARGTRLRQVSTTTPVPERQGETFACVQFEPEVRYRNNGYDHVVHLRSRCDRRTICTIATDVNPTPVNVDVPPHEQVEVLTFRGSPAREFTPNLSCRFAP